MKKNSAFYFVTVLFFTIFLATAVFAETGIITGNGVRLRRGSSTKSKIITHMYKGDNVEILEKGKSWTYISFNGKKGYVSNTYLKVNKEEEAKAFSLSEDSEDIIEYAKKFLGVKYKYGGTTPNGFDCAGYTYYVFKHFGVTLPTGATSQYNSSNVTKISKSELQKGDLVFFSSPKSKKKIAHVGIYVGDNKFIHANSPGGSVRITTMASGYYKTYYYGAARVKK